MSSNYIETRDLQTMLREVYGANHLTVQETPEFEQWEDKKWFNPPADLEAQILTREQFIDKHGNKRNPRHAKDDGVKPGAI